MNRWWWILFGAVLGAAVTGGVLRQWGPSRPDANPSQAATARSVNAPAGPAQDDTANQNKGGPRPAGGPPPALVRVDRAARQTLANRWSVTGRLQEVRRTIVDAEVSGRIEQVPVEIGQHVEGPDENGGGGTILAQIDPIWSQLRLKAAKAALERARAEQAEQQAQFQRAQRNYHFLQQLERTNSARVKEVQDALDQMTADEARRDSAARVVEAMLVQLDQMNEENARLLVRAPFSGFVVRKLLEAGQWVQAGTPVADIVSSGDIDALIDVPEHLINLLSMGQTLPVKIDVMADQSFNANVAAIVPKGSDRAGTFPVKLRLANPDGVLKAGMSVTVLVPTSATEPVLTVPRDAVLRTPNGTIVWLADNRIAQQVAVAILFGAADRYAVRPLPGPTAAALIDGAVVVVEGGERIFFPGQPLNVMQDETASVPRRSSEAVRR